ncbi:MAG: hypothetical protein QXM06_04745 [Archaeoglobaceae archaeon]
MLLVPLNVGFLEAIVKELPAGQKYAGSTYELRWKYQSNLQSTQITDKDKKSVPAGYL